MQKKKLTLEIYNPNGVIETFQSCTSRLDTLEGKTLGEVSNRIWEADRTFPLIRQLLQTRFPSIKIIPYTEFHTIMYNEFPTIMCPEPENIGDLVKAKGCDAVIVGNAA